MHEPPAHFRPHGLRRRLRLADGDAVLHEVETLLALGYERKGNWTLAQICTHLATVIEMSIDGFPMRPLPRLVQRAARWLFLDKIMRRHVFRRQIPTPQFLLPTGPQQDRPAVERLRTALGRLANHCGPMQPSPIFGPLSTGEWQALHLWHCEHHLSFLWPRAAPPPNAE